MFMLRLMQVFSWTLWFCLVFGTYEAIRDRIYLPMLAGIPTNLAFQYSIRVAIRKRKIRLGLEPQS